MPALFYPLVDKLPPGTIGMRKKPTANWPGSDPIDQEASARTIEREARAAGLPPELAAAMIVNAMSESYLDPKAKGDLKDGAYRSIGLFQLFNEGVGRAMTLAQKEDPATNTRKIIDELWARKGASKPVHGAAPDYRHEDPLTAYERGVRDVGHLSDMFAIYVEGALWRKSPRKGHKKRLSHARNFFPSYTSRATLPAPGAQLPSPTARPSTLVRGSTPQADTSASDWPDWLPGREWLPGPMKRWLDEEPATVPTQSTRKPRRETESSGSWTASSQSFTLTSGSKSYTPGTVPAGSYHLTWNGTPVVPVKIAPGVAYRAWTEGTTINFARS